MKLEKRIGRGTAMHGGSEEERMSCGLIAASVDKREKEGREKKVTKFDEREIKKVFKKSGY